MSTPNYPFKCARPRDAASMLGITSTTLWRWSKERADFPKPIKLGEVVTVWRISDLEEFVARQATLS
jgi:prophage regulatory protein